MSNGFKIVPLGIDAVSVEFGDVIAVELNERAIAFADAISADPFDGLSEAFPAYSSVTVTFDPSAVRRMSAGGETVFETVSTIISNRISQGFPALPANSRIVEIPVDFSSSAGPDLSECAERSGIPVDEFIKFFTSGEYRVFMLGFLPGFAYMGTVDEKLAQPRRDVPRNRVEKGSVGIAGRQTGIYPLASPGGWQIIGRTTLELFTPESARPALLSSGDRVRFVEI